MFEPERGPRLGKKFEPRVGWAVMVYLPEKEPFPARVTEINDSYGDSKVVSYERLDGAREKDELQACDISFIREMPKKMRQNFDSLRDKGLE